MELSEAHRARSAANPSNAVPALSPVESAEYLLPLVERAREDPRAALAALRARGGAGAPDVKELIVTQVVAPAFDIGDPDDPVRESYRLAVSGNYPTDDNFYLAMPVERSGSQVLFVRFRAPGVARAIADYPTADVRYFSIGQGDERSYNMQTLHDAQLDISEDGFVHLLIGDDSPRLRAKAAALGANFMAWQVGEKMLLVYRNMLPRAGYEHGTDSVPFYDHGRSAASQAGRAFIGDYAPVGLLVAEEDILAADGLPAI